MKIFDKANCAQLLERAFAEREKELISVRAILADVRARGDDAVFDYERKFDATELDASTFRVSEEEFEEAYKAVSPELLSSLKKAIANIYRYHSRTGRRDNVVTENGRTTGYVVRPVASAGIYAPGGTAPLSPSVLIVMLPSNAPGAHPPLPPPPPQGSPPPPRTPFAPTARGRAEQCLVGVPAPVSAPS